MPELPEIEHLAASLRAAVVGRELVGVRCRQPKMLNLPLADFAALARGPVLAVERRAKSAVLRLERGSIWLHLGLSGEVRLGEPPQAEPQLALRFADGSELVIDKSFMGHAHFIAAADSPRRWSEFGPEPLAEDFDLATLEAVLAAKPKQNLKALLMDQGRLAGVGNVYSDEVLHAARLHPGRTAGSLTPEQRRRLHEALRAVLSAAVAAGGADDYADAHGERGRYVMRIHGAHQCAVCGGPASKATFAGRTAYFCPSCQSTD
ncbi:MAG: Fpg/Nei family DNA glycosylase [Chloroflexota bacterium]